MVAFCRALNRLNNNLNIKCQILLIRPDVYLSLHCQKDENKQKRPGLAHIKNNVKGSQQTFFIRALINRTKLYLPV